ncbi:hypothetical protein [Opitutus terrae]|uniref:Uncharacterized protein n=1 Tax=Opitutus terrae (strain DSM 11246 / JCM 15787 / PB90-1) TaxID=452637 RepID=B1ZNP8_OPITP|nr:hypothetical protein [Opitutus terrae]ACB75418.1 hypothetical protein Oter_2135 [Opitutus terrae PB90-1]
MKSSTESPNLETTHSPAPATDQWHGHVSDDVSATSGPLPKASLTATDHELVIVGPRTTYRVERTAVTRIGRGQLYPWLFGGLRIRHNVPGLSAELQFKPLGCPAREVLQRLRTLGYPVQ